MLIGIAGQPDVGKSTVFNLVTGLSQHIGNWPGKTIERREGTVTCDGTTLRIVDLPGTYSLTASSPEERITRGFILRERPDVIVMIADAPAPHRNLYLLAEVPALPPPAVTAKVTVVPATGLPWGSATRTAGATATVEPTMAAVAGPAPRASLGVMTGPSFGGNRLSVRAGSPSCVHC